MAHKTYQELMKLEIAACLAKSDAAENISHMPTRGATLEFGLCEIISKFLPHGWDIGKGKIIDNKGAESADTDIIIYNKTIIPPAMLYATSGLYPVESCGYAIEVKTTSTKKGVRSTYDNFKRLRQIGKDNGKDLLTVYFARKSNLKRESELDRYKKIDPKFNTDPVIKIICVLGQGYWYFSPEFKGAQLVGFKWRFVEGLKDGFELAWLISGIINTLTPGPARFGMYIIDNEKKFKDIEKYKFNSLI
ncbi:DUF6602 domain-containing protein [Roseivirga sp. BDSF3-8]|uniref:DUF6602 domain-containing protein n=1 Tax=Roseivirga sp. BDSF3-8 TaxID=3241598 RepID=UPI003531BC52